MITITVTLAAMILLTLEFLGPNLVQARTSQYNDGYNMGCSLQES